MSQAIPNTSDEDAFMNNLLLGLHPVASASSTSTAPKTPSRAAGTRPATHSNDLDISMLLDGAENWDWSEMEADFLTPKKSNAGQTPLKVRVFLVATLPLTREGNIQ